MPMYLDPAIIVKLLVRETDSEWFGRNLVGQIFEASELALADVRYALLAQERAGQITKSERVMAEKKFQAMLEEEIIRLLPLNRTVLERAKAIQMACHPHLSMRTIDSLHVATCALHNIGTMATTDGRRRAACEQFGIALIPAKPEDVTNPT